MATFEEALAELPFTPTTDSGRGFLPVFQRAVGHFLYVLGRLTDTPTRRPTDNQIREEIDSIKLHFTDLIIPDYMSTRSKTYIENFQNAFNILDAEIESWDAETRVNNLRSLDNRAIQLMAFLDREVLGIDNSDPGQSL
jgi:hypothetical protein